MGMRKDCVQCDFIGNEEHYVQHSKFRFMEFHFRLNKQAPKCLTFSLHKFCVLRHWLDLSDKCILMWFHLVLDFDSLLVGIMLWLMVLFLSFMFMSFYSSINIFFSSSSFMLSCCVSFNSTDCFRSHLSIFFFSFLFFAEFIFFSFLDAVVFYAIYIFFSCFNLLDVLLALFSNHIMLLLQIVSLVVLLERKNKKKFQIHNMFVSFFYDQVNIRKRFILTSTGTACREWGKKRNEIFTNQKMFSYMKARVCLICGN